MALVLAEGVVEVTADAKNVPGQIAKDVDDGNGKLAESGTRAGGSLFGAIMKSAIVLKGLDIVGDFLGGSITNASDLAETASKGQTIFGNYFGQIDKWTNRSAETLGLSKEAALASATSFGNMFTQLGFAGQQAADMSRAVVQTAADLGSFNNLDTADVSDRMAAAFRGEYDSLQALIPNINAARVEQEALAMTGKTATSELTAQEKAAAVLAIVQRDGAAAMGDYAKTADGAANTQKTLTASMEDQQAKLGTTLMPLWQGFLGFLTDTAIPVLSSIIDFIGQNAEWLGPLALALGVVTGAVWLFNIALNANPIMLVITGIALLVGALIWVATQTTFFQDVFRVAGEVVGNVFSFIGTVATWLYENVLAPIFGFVVGYVTIWVNVFLWLAGIVSGVFQGIGAAFTWVWSNVISPVVGWITGAIGSIGKAVETVFGGISGFIGDVFRNVVNVIKGPINTVIGFLNQAIDGANVVGGVFGVTIGRIPMLANGGKLTSGGTVLVGERGPELLNLPGGASVVPLTSGQRAQGAGGGGDVNVALTVKSENPSLAGRQFARALTARLGI